jgi:hypothetical protein
MSQTFSILELIDRLIGPIVPIGDPTEDDLRLENLRKLAVLSENLLAQLAALAENRVNDPIFLRRAGEEAHDCLVTLNTWLHRLLEGDDAVED